MIELKAIKPFAQGGNRLCFVHPDDPDLCVKVRRPDFTLEDLRKKKGFPKNLRKLSSFDDNLEEYRVVQRLEKVGGSTAFRHVYRCYEFIDTDLGPGLVTELIRDGDGQVSVSLKQYLWEVGYPPECQRAVGILTNFWLENVIPSRELLTHNIVVQRDLNGQINRLVVIDGLGSSTLIPFSLLPSALQKVKIKTKIKRLNARISEFLSRCAQGKKPSHVGMLNHRDVTVKNSVVE